MPASNDVQWICGCADTCFQLPERPKPGAKDPTDNIHGKCHLRDVCCSTQCCQRSIDDAELIFEKCEEYFGIPRGGQWQERSKHNDQPNPKFHGPRKARNNAVKRHISCLEEYAKGQGYTNAQREANGDAVIPMHRVTLRVDVNGNADEGLSKTANQVEFDKLQKIYENSDTGLEDRAIYTRVIKDTLTSLSLSQTQIRGGKEAERTGQRAQHGATVPPPAIPYQEAVISSSRPHNTSKSTTMPGSLPSSSLAGSMEMASLASSSNLPYRPSPTPSMGSAPQEEQPNYTQLLDEDIFNFLEPEWLRSPSPDKSKVPEDPRVARLTELEDHVASNLDLIQNQERFETLSPSKQKKKFVSRYLKMKKTWKQSQHIANALEKQEPIPQAFDQVRLQNLKQQMQELQHEIQLYHSQLQKWYHEQLPDVQQHFQAALLQSTSMAQGQGQGQGQTQRQPQPADQTQQSRNTSQTRKKPTSRQSSVETASDSSRDRSRPNKAPKESKKAMPQ